MFDKIDNTIACEVAIGHNNKTGKVLNQKNTIEDIKLLPPHIWWGMRGRISCDY